MPNESKLGLLAGVAGVVTAAVLFYQNQPAPPPPTGTTSVRGTGVKPPVVGTPSKPASEPTATPVTGRGRKEPTGSTVSRSADEDE